MINWLSASASVIGSGHVSSGTPCQDSHCCIERNDGRWLAMVVSDGAGTAAFSDKSSAFVVKSFANALINLSREIESREPGAWINDFVISQILSTRNELRNLAKSDSLKDYHCTLVACLVGETGGFVIHIGDGAAFGGAASLVDSEECSLSDITFSSLPENGEYSNETYFITEADWIKHLRITPITNADWVILGTDGGTALAMLSDKEPKPGFITPLLTSLLSEESPEARNAKLTEVLGDTQANKLTNDDKTICIAFRQKLKEFNKKFVMGSSVTKPPEVEGQNVANIVELLNPEKKAPTKPNLWKKKISWKIQLSKKILAVLIALLIGALIVSFVIMEYEVAVKAYDSLKGNLNEVLGL